MQRNTQNLVMTFLYANQVKKYLEGRNIDVESNFVTQQALIGWMLDNPWMSAFLMQNEISRLDNLDEGVRTAELLKIKNDLAISNGKVSGLENERDKLTGDLSNANGMVTQLTGDRDKLTAELSDANVKIITLEKAIGVCKKEAIVVLKNSAASGSEKTVQTIDKSQTLIQIAKSDNLAQINGIGPKIQSILNQYGITTFTQLTEKTAQELDSLLEKANIGLGITNTDKWIEDARSILSKNKKE